MKRIGVGLGVIAASLLLFSAAFAAQGGEGNNTGCNGVGNPNSPCQGTVNNGGQGGQGGVGVGVGIGGGAKVTNTVTNTNVNAQSQAQGQKQSQRQSQKQGQAQGQNNDQTIAPAQSVSVDASTSFDRYAPGIAAPSLTAAGTGVCLGSVSVGLTGPMAGATFGITKVDHGCELRSNAALLYQMGYRDAAVRLLMKNDDVRDAMGGEPGVKPASTDGKHAAASTEVVGVSQQVLSNFGARDEAPQTN